MSGPKDGHLQFDIEAVRRSLRDQSAAEAARLEALTQEVASLTDASPLAEVKQRELEQLAMRQAERERISAELEQMRGQLQNSALAQAMTTYDAATNTLSRAIAQRGEIEARYPGIALPPIPDLPPVDMSTLESILQARQSVLSVAAHYQAAMDTVIAAFQKVLATREAVSEMRADMVRFKTRAIRLARDVIQLLDSESEHVASTARDIRLHSMASAAARMVETLKRSEEYGLSDALMAQLDRVFEAENESNAQMELERLSATVADEARRHAALAEQRAAMERERQRLQRRMETTEVAQLVARTLEDLGYSVSGIDETVFVSHGHLYALDKTWPDHALRLQFEPNGERLRAELVRVGGDTPESKADEKTQREIDRQVDEAWCSADGIGKLRETLARRGVKVRFESKHAPGAVDLARVTVQALGDRLVAGRTSSSREPGALRSRTHKPQTAR